MQYEHRRLSLVETQQSSNKSIGGVGGGDGDEEEHGGGGGGGDVGSSAKADVEHESPTLPVGARRGGGVVAAVVATPPSALRGSTGNDDDKDTLAYYYMPNHRFHKSAYPVGEKGMQERADRPLRRRAVPLVAALLTRQRRPRLETAVLVTRRRWSETGDRGTSAPSFLTTNEKPGASLRALPARTWAQTYREMLSQRQVKRGR
mmetsp:Transcript_82689/g.165282  ORF Transcript_82689/g.165282 Transcript_82689/m.165282 type:complete len:204 (-) Transcript_82689:182-793(-)